MNMATGQLDKGLYRRHTAWLKAKRHGVGRLEIKDELLRRMKAAALDLSHIHLEKCDLFKSDFNNAHLISAELKDCDFSYSNLHMCWLAKSFIERCLFEGATLTLVRMDGSVSAHCNYNLANMRRVSLVDARFDHCTFEDCDLEDSKITRSMFVDCSFTGADFMRVVALSQLGKIKESTFIRCNFRGADFEGVRIEDTKFHNCEFKDAKGRPELDADVKAIWSSASEDWSKANVLEGLQLIQDWESGALYKR